MAANLEAMASKLIALFQSRCIQSCSHLKMSFTTGEGATVPFGVSSLCQYIAYLNVLNLYFPCRDSSPTQVGIILGPVLLVVLRVQSDQAVTASQLWQNKKLANLPPEGTRNPVADATLVA